MEWAATGLDGSAKIQSTVWTSRAKAHLALLVATSWAKDAGKTPVPRRESARHSVCTSFAPALVFRGRSAR